MNTFQRSWLTWKHSRKFTKHGRGCLFPFPDLTVEGDVVLGDLCRFRNNVTLRTYGSGKIIVGNRSGFSWNCLVEATGTIRIGNRTGFAENTLLSDRLLHVTQSDANWQALPAEGKGIVVGHDCFIGSGCFIGPGVSIGDGAVISPHSIVCRDVGPGEIWGGAPCRFMGHRTKGVSEKILRESQALIAQYGVAEDREAGRYKEK